MIFSNILSAISLTLLVASLPSWAVTLISIAGSALVTSIIGYLVKKYLDRYFKKKEEQENIYSTKIKELESLRNDQMREQRKEDMEEIVKAELGPINEKIDSLISTVEKTADGTLSSLRTNILTCYYRCCKKGYRGDWDFENIHHLFDSYKKLNGNSFIRDVMVRFDELPSKEEYFKTHKDNSVNENSEDDDF